MPLMQKERGRRNIKREWNEEETEIKGKRT